MYVYIYIITITRFKIAAVMLRRVILAIRVQLRRELVRAFGLGACIQGAHLASAGFAARPDASADPYQLAYICF